MPPLPKGITGFDAPDDGVPVKHFTAACHAAARRVGGQVMQVRAASGRPGSTNFHEALLSLRSQQEAVRVLCNAHFPVLAFAKPRLFGGDGAPPDFCDCEELAIDLREGFSVLTREDACAGVSNEMVASLGNSELAQLRYWRPQRLGDVIFNFWD